MQTQIPAQQAQQSQSRAEQKSPQSAQPQFEDARPESAAQLRMQSLMANSAQSTQLKSMQAMMAANTPAKKLGQSPGAINPIPVQRMEEEEPLQTKTDEPIQREQTAAPNAENPNAETPPDSTPPPKPNNTGLPDNLKAGIENLSGISMDHVKVHYNSDKPAQLQAHAYAQGSEIHVAPGQEKHLPHEAWHVVQQAQRRVRPTFQMKGGVDVNDDEGLEREADVMGGRAIQLMQRRMTGNVAVNSFYGQKKLVQRVIGNHGHNIVGEKVKEKSKPDQYTIESIVRYEKGQYFYGVSNKSIGYCVAASDLEWERVRNEERRRDIRPMSLESVLMSGVYLLTAINIGGELIKCLRPGGLTADAVVQDFEVKLANEIINNYLLSIGASKKIDAKKTRVRFYDAESWGKLIKEKLPRDNPAEVEGFALEDDIAISKDNHTIGTIVHEMFHDVSNCSYGVEWWDEAITEYFTQLALSVDARFSKDCSEAIYVERVSLLKMMIGNRIITHEDLINAYFKCDKDVAKKFRRVFPSEDGSISLGASVSHPSVPPSAPLPRQTNIIKDPAERAGKEEKRGK